jgi:hypothetical protein
MKQQYFYFAVRRTKSMVDSTGRTRNVPVLVYGTKTFQSSAEVLKEYSQWMATHTNELYGIFQYSKRIKINPTTHEAEGWINEEQQQ